ncbi:MAG: sensor histidine kinase [Alphaproteobacteria bacterium]|nr:MAG: sensor histidine kinase [Alphaproteobacteria bacterium]
MIKGEEKERGRLAQELHDGIGGMLTAITLNVKALQRRHAGLRESRELDEILIMLRDTALEVRGTAHNLMPDILLDYSIPEALQMYCDHLNREDLQVNLHFHGPVEHMDKFTTLAIYRVVQELLQNIIKHAEASIAEIQLRSDQKKIILTVEDNGKGFSSESTSDGLGLKTMKTRIEAMGGFVSVESTPGMGTTVYIELSLDEAQSTIHGHSYSHS